MQYVIAVLVLLALGWAIYLFLSRRERDDDSWDADSHGDGDVDGPMASGLADRGRVNPGTVFDGPPMPAVRPRSDSTDGLATPAPPDVPLDPGPVAPVVPAVPLDSSPVVPVVPDPPVAPAAPAAAASRWTWADDERRTPDAAGVSREAEIAARTEALAAELPVSQDAVPDVAVAGDHVGEAAAAAMALGLGPAGDAGVEAAQEESTVADAAVQVPAYDPSSSYGEADPTEMAPVDAVAEVETREELAVVATPETVEVSAATEDVADAEASVAHDLDADGSADALDDAPEALAAPVAAPVAASAPAVDPERPASSSWEQTHGIDTSVFAPPAGAFGTTEPTAEPAPAPESPAVEPSAVEVEPDVVSDGDTASEMVSEGDPNLGHGRHEAHTSVVEAPAEAVPAAEVIAVEPDVVNDGDTAWEMVSEGDPNVGHGWTAPVTPDPEPVTTEPTEPEPAPDATPASTWVRRISAVAEIRDGGYGWGSAAPFDDLAMPYGHPVKAWNDTRTYRDPDNPNYDEAEPHVWFTDDGAAERAGFRPAD